MGVLHDTLEMQGSRITSEGGGGGGGGGEKVSSEGGLIGWGDRVMA